VARAETAALVASLTLDDKGFSKGISTAQKKLGDLESTSFRVGQRIGGGLQSLGKNLAVLGTVGVAGLTTQVVAGLHSLEELETVGNQTAAVIASTGGKAGVSAKQVREYAESLEDLTTVDDKQIQAAENLLLTFTNISDKAFPDATEAVINLGIAMAEGDVANADFKASAIQVGKALNDPIKGITALSRVGVSFTKQQKDQIKALTESGDILGAQKIILRELETEFGKAGEAAGTGFGADMRRVGDAVEGAQQALATGFLPVIQKVAKFLQTELAKPSTIKAIKDFGEGLAGTFEDLLAAAGRIPWAQIGDSLKIAGTGAKAILDAFLSLPPWVQTAVITGWGLNKLTGGALTGIAGEIAKGLIGSKLGERGGTPANPLFVSAVGGGLGGAAPVGAAGGAGKLATAANLIMKVAIVGIAADVASTLKPAVVGAGIEIHDALGLPTLKPDDLQWPFGPKNTPTILPEIFGGNGALGGTPVTPKAQGQLVGPDVAKVAAAQNITNERLEAIKSDTAKQNAKADALNAQFANVGTSSSAIKAAVDTLHADEQVTATKQNITNERLEAINGTSAAITAAVHNSSSQAAAIAARNQAAAFAIRDRVSTSGTLVAGAVNAVKSVAAATTTATQTVASRQNIANERLEAIRRKDFSPTVNVSAKFSIQELSKGQKTFTKTFHSTVS
jgi:hypothetical protein